MSKLKFIGKYIKHRISAKNRHGLHSPFAFDLYKEVISDKRNYYAFEDIESIRAKLLLSKQKIPIKDHGAGSRVNSSSKRSISDIAKNSLSGKKEGQMLFKLVNSMQPKRILELGTSLGITTMYLASPQSKSKVITIEGCPNTAKVARINFDKLGYENIELIRDTFDNALPKVLQKGFIPDLVYIDGNHKKEATLNYFNQLIKKLPENAIMVFDDIYWSTDMEEAWEEIKAHPVVNITFDLFFLGIVFLRKEQAEEHFKLRF